MYAYGIVLTGGIATGKSTVCELLKEKGLEIIDADRVAKEQILTCKPELKELFGEVIFNGNEIDRVKLGNIIFSDKKEREKLNSLLHPKIKAEIKRQALKLENLKKHYILDIPLFFENGGYEAKMSVVIYTPKEIQLKRLMKRNSLSLNEAQNRINSQMDIEKKKNKADFVIDNSLDLEHLKQSVEGFISLLKLSQ